MGEVPYKTVRDNDMCKISEGLDVAAGITTGKRSCSVRVIGTGHHGPSLYHSVTGFHSPCFAFEEFSVDIR
jgi:hypothetical protein